MLANINIVNESNRFQYVVEYEKINQFSTDPYCEIGGDIYLTPSPSKLIRKGNEWEEHMHLGGDHLLNQEYKKSKINVFLPRFSVDTYSTGVYYTLDLSTWVSGKRIVLGSYVFNRLDTYASERVRIFYNENYYEKISFDIIDPYELIYSDSWRNFRETICGERYNEDLTLNNTGAIIHCSIYPVEKIGDKYIKINGFEGGQNSINITDNDRDFLRLELNTNIDKPLMDDEPSFICDLNFNDVYDKNLKEYFLETYNTELKDMKFELVIGSEDDIYAILQKNSLSSRCIFTKKEIEDFFTNRIGWKEGIYVTSSVIISDGDEEIMYVLSNKIPLTETLIGYFIKDDLNIHHIDLTQLNMNNYNLTIPNKIQKKVVQLTGYNNTKNNIIQPQFFRTSQLSNMVIHPEVTENICINLDQYKSLVDTFVIKVEGCSFPEIGRTSSGIMFKIKGGILPRKKTEGVYYVVDQNSTLITTGKYIYEE